MSKKRIEDVDPNLRIETDPDDDGLQWRRLPDARLPLRGLPWQAENGAALRRLPTRAEAIVRPNVWHLAQHTAGGCVAFRSDARRMRVRWQLREPGVMPHMPASGSNGLALYAGAMGRLRPWATAMPEAGQTKFERALFADVQAKPREFRLYLPLYQGIASLEIGLPADAAIDPPTAPALDRPVVFYGTSITQGGCASTPGSDYVARLGRQLNLEVVNLGFSGNGRGEPEVAELIAEIDAALFVLDYAANANPLALRQTLPVFVRILREHHPHTPVLIVTNPCFSAYDHVRATRETLELRRDNMIEFYIRQRKSGDSNVHLADGFSLLPYGAEGAYVDGVHPTDHGFQLMASRLSPVIERILFSDLNT